MADVDGQPATALAAVHAMAPLAPHLAGLVEGQGEVPVWGSTTPSEAAGIDPEWIRLGPRWSDVARLLWEVEPTDHAEVVAAYLRASGRSHRRRQVASAIEELGAAETAMVAEEALEAKTTESWPAVEATLARVRTGAVGASAQARRDEEGARMSRWGHFCRATTALVSQQLQEHYAESFLGLGWTVLRPLLYFAVLVLAFGKVVRVDEPHYPEFLLAGLLPWLFFQTAVGEATSSIRGRGDLLRLAAFPRAALPLATVASALVDFTAQLLVVIPVVVLIDGPPPLRLLALIPIVAALIALVAAASLVVAGLTVRFRDLAHFVPLVLFLGFYVVPVFYSSSRLHLPWRAVYLLNPLSVLIETFRSCVHGGPWPPAWALASALVIVTAGSVAASRWFSAASDRFVAEA
jgi:ABC-type polysaccharide/polyol phosphate export permease